MKDKMEMKMKDKIFYSFIGIICIIIILINCHYEAVYTMKGTVYNVNGNEITFKDITGNLFSCYTEESSPNVHKGEKFILKLTNECTESDRTDDKLIGFGKHSFLCFVY